MLHHLKQRDYCFTIPSALGVSPAGSVVASQPAAERSPPETRNPINEEAKFLAATAALFFGRPYRLSPARRIGFLCAGAARVPSPLALGPWF